MGRASLRSDIGKPRITLHGTLDVLPPIRRYANIYREMVENQVKAKMHRYYVIENGNHVDPFYNLYLRRARPPCGGTALLQGSVRGARAMGRERRR